MKYLLLIIILIGCIVLMFKYPAKEVTYNCDLVEISPDVPPGIKQECRELINSGMV